jgi:hypothetical protein
MTEMSRRRLLGLAGAGAAGALTSRLVGEPLLGQPAGAAESDTTADPPEFRTRLTERYGMKYPIVQAGFSALYVTPELAAAVSNAGGLGCLGAAPEPGAGVRNLIRRTKALTDRPFGMDFVYFPMNGNTVWTPGYEDDKEHRTREINWSCNDSHIDACIEEGVAYVVFFWTAPEARWVKRLNDAGIPVWAQVGTVRGALEAVDWGAEVIIAQGMQAGGHCRGYQDAEPTMRQELVPRVKEAVPPEIVVLGAGGIADGQTLANALREGAEAAWVGTVFCASRLGRHARQLPVRAGMAGRLHPGDHEPRHAAVAGQGGPAAVEPDPRAHRTAPPGRLHRSGRNSLRDAEVQPHVAHQGHDR